MVIDLPEFNEPAAEPWSTPPAISAARGLLKPPVEADISIWRLVALSALVAGSALALATAIVMGPPRFH